MASDPSTFNLSSNTPSKVVMSWTSSGADKYRIYRSVHNENTYRKIFECSGSVFAYTDYVSNYANDASALEYDYRLTAVDADGSNESTGLDDTATMPELTSSNVQSVTVLASKLKSGSSTTSYTNTYSNDSASIALSNAHRYIWEQRQANGIYDDRTKQGA